MERGGRVGRLPELIGLTFFPETTANPRYNPLASYTRCTIGSIMPA